MPTFSCLHYCYDYHVLFTYLFFVSFIRSFSLFLEVTVARKEIILSIIRNEIIKNNYFFYLLKNSKKKKNRERKK